jgi:hypothetical protein
MQPSASDYALRWLNEFGAQTPAKSRNTIAIGTFLFWVASITAAESSINRGSFYINPPNFKKSWHFWSIFE